MSSPPSWLRFVQIFSAKLVLEVFGGGGAIWGFSEVLTLRNPNTQETWRLYASIVAAIFFVRFILQTKDYISEIYGKKNTIDSERIWVRLIQIFSAKLVLEVFGGGGAIWGFSEVLTLRNPVTQELWRFIAAVVGGIFFARYLLQMHDFVGEIYGRKCVVDSKKNYLRLVQIFSAKLVLEVFGGGGAIWGFSEVVTLRNPTTQEQWRFNAAVVGAIFFARFLLQVKDYVAEMFGEKNPYVDAKTYSRLIQIFSAKLVLEVFGGGGAIWGFSEVLTLRNPETQEQWRFYAATIAAIFLARFILQIHDFVEEIKEAEVDGKLNSKSNGHSYTNPSEITDDDVKEAEKVAYNSLEEAGVDMNESTPLV